MYNVFIRTWWKKEGGRIIPGAGKRRYIARGVSQEEALRLCARWNDSHDPGPLSRKAEFERA